MACLAMHLAIAEKYLEKNPNENKEAFMIGAYLPDIEEDKIKSHYGIRMPIRCVKDMLDSKVDIIECAKNTDLNNDLSKAVFLHLTTDYLFYNFVYSPSLETKTPEQIKNMMYQDFDFVTKHVLNKYKINIPQQINHIVKSKDGDINSTFFNAEQIDKFIDLVSKLDLKDCKQQFLNDPKVLLNEFLEKMTMNSEKTQTLN